MTRVVLVNWNVEGI